MMFIGPALTGVLSGTRSLKVSSCVPIPVRMVRAGR